MKKKFNFFYLEDRLKSLKLMEVTQKSYEKYKNDEAGIQKFINDIVTDFDTTFNKTVESVSDLFRIGEFKKKKKNQLIFLIKIIKPGTLNDNLQIKCPQKCDQNSLTVWISLFGALMGLTLVTVIFVSIYLIFSKIQYRNLTKKMYG